MRWLDDLKRWWAPAAWALDRRDRLRSERGEAEHRREGALAVHRHHVRKIREIEAAYAAESRRVEAAPSVTHGTAIFDFDPAYDKHRRAASAASRASDRLEVVIDMLEGEPMGLAMGRLWTKGDVGYFYGGPRKFTVVRHLPGVGLFRVRYFDCDWAGVVADLYPHQMRTSMTAFHAMNRKYGWHPPTGPSEHPLYELPAHHQDAANLPASVDLEAYCPPVYDQLQLGSCTGNALAALVQFLLIKLGLASWVPSRLFIYYNERAIEGTISQDAGADGDDGMTALATKGVPPESLWPYDQSKFADCPPPPAWGSATKCKLLDPVTIADGDLHGLKSRLATGYPVAFGFVAYPGLESDKTATTGILPMPAEGEASIGGHEVLLVGYDDAKRMFKARNSWGPGWGLKGYFWMPYAYVGDAKLASTFRSASKVS